jgi:hypothetical protein
MADVSKTAPTTSIRAQCSRGARVTGSSLAPATRVTSATGAGIGNAQRRPAPSSTSAVPA